MRKLAVVFLSVIALTAVNGRNILDSMDDEPQGDGYNWPVDSDVSFIAEDSYVPMDEIDGLTYPVDSLENGQDEIFEDLSLADDKYEEYSVTGCHGGKCELRFKLWKLKGTFVVQLSSEGIHVEFKAFGKRLYSHMFNTDRDITLTVKKNKLPKWMRKLMKSDLKIEFSDVDLEEKRICVQLRVKLRWLGTVKWPRHSPHCFTL